MIVTFQVPMSGLFQEIRNSIRVRHYSVSTERAYIQWIKRLVRFHRGVHPRDMGKLEIEAFLTHLAVDRKVAHSTQNQALQAILFMYREVLELELPWVDAQMEWVRALHQKDLAAGHGAARLPLSLQNKFGSSSQRSCWQYLFPARELSSDPREKGRIGRWHIHPVTVRRGGERGGQSRLGQARNLPYASAFIRHAFAGIRHGYPHHSAIAGAQGCENDDDLYPRGQSWCFRRGIAARPG